MTLPNFGAVQELLKGAKTLPDAKVITSQVDSLKVKAGDSLTGSQEELQKAQTKIKEWKDTKDVDTAKKAVSAKNKKQATSKDFELPSVKQMVDKFKDSPAFQMGKDYVTEQFSRNSKLIMNNVETAARSKLKPLFNKFYQLQALGFNAVTAFLTSVNDAQMYFIQVVAKNAIKELKKKRVILLELQAKLTELYNAILIFNAGGTFFPGYLSKLRQALLNVYEGRNSFIRVRNALFTREQWLKIQFTQGIEALDRAKALLEPPPGKKPANTINGGLLGGVGVQQESDQLTAFVMIPLLVQQVAAAAAGYFISVLKVNALLLAYTLAYGTLQTVRGGRITTYTIEVLDNMINDLDDLVGAMSHNLNGQEFKIDGPVLNFKPDPLVISARVLVWNFRLIVLTEQAKVMVPGPVISNINASNDALSLYNKSVLTIKSKGNRSLGDAILLATEGREEVGQLERQLSVFTLGTLKALASNKSSQNLLPLGRAILKRLELTLIQDQEIEVALSSFAFAKLPGIEAIKKTGDGLRQLMRDMGLDKAADSLERGAFGEFFNMDAKTATYAGAALVGLAKLKQCLESEEDQVHLEEAANEIKKDVKAKELFLKRSTTFGVQAYEDKLQVDSNLLDTTVETALAVSGKCDFPSDFQPDALMKHLGPILGVNILGNKAIGSKFQKLGKGII